MSSRINATLLNSIITFLGFIDTYLLIPVIALYATSLGAGVEIVGIIVGVYSITSSITNIFGGRLIDRFGHKKPLIIGLFGDTLAMFIYTLCQLPWHLLLVRAFHGISGGLVGPATMSISAKNASQHGKGKAMSIYGIALGTATLIGFLISGMITSQFGFIALFYTGGILLVIGVIMSFFVRSDKGTGKITSAAEGHVIKDMLKLSIRGRLPVSYLSIFGQYFSFGGVVVLLPLHVASLGMSSFHVGILLAIFSLMFVIVQSFSGALTDNMGRLRPIAIGLGLGTISIVLLSLSQSFLYLALSISVYGAAFGILFPSVSALLADSVTPEEYGRATGIFHALITVGVAIGAPIIGWIAAFNSVGTGLIFCVIMLVSALILTLLYLTKKGSNNIAS
jgi:MFS family permease